LRYVSTRGIAPVLGFEDVLLAGLATDGGLYVPAEWPQLDAAAIRTMDGLPYHEVAFRVIRPFIDADAIDDAELLALLAETYAVFDHPAVTPLRQMDSATWLLELFHGPTLAFKDVALQLLGRLFERVLAKRGERVTIVGATSGDTGSAAIEACRGRDNIDIFILHPAGRVSEVQRRQMTTVEAANVHNIAVEGTFDDCQDMVKAMFNDAAFRAELNLSAVNSINWARIVAQTVYYFVAASALGAPDRKITFVVPTGNFGNVYAGYVAHRMGLPVERFLVASNRNDILTRFFERGDMSMAPVVPSLSPSMDIQVSSNFERLLFELVDRQGTTLAETMTEFRATGTLAAGGNLQELARALFTGRRRDDDETLATIRAIHEATGELVDPHSAVALGAAADAGDTGKTVVLATAHPAKFPDAVERATGLRPGLPPRLSDLFDRPERLSTLPNELARVQDFVRNPAVSGSAA
jgi:threonine synthase